MKATFAELPMFSRLRERYLDDEAYRRLQNIRLDDAEAGDVVQGTGGLRKLRFGDARRGKGKRGGLRVVYFRWEARAQFWLFTLYDKDEVDDLTPAQRVALRDGIKAAISRRSM